MANFNTVLSVIAIEPRRIGGAEIWFRELSRQLAERGWKSVLCFLAPPPEQVREFLQQSNVVLEVLADSWKFRPAPALAFDRLIKRHRPRIVHLNYTGFVSLFPWISRLRGVEQVYFHDHGSKPEGYVPRPASSWKRAVVRCINRPITRVFCVSEYNRSCNVVVGLLPSQRYALLYNGIDIRRGDVDSERRSSSFRKRYGIPDGRAVVMQVGWMIPEKGIGDLLRAAVEVLRQRRDVQFVLVGDGAERNAFEKIANELGITGHVTFTGEISDPMRQGAYATADVICQLSRWQEAFGQTIVEAMAACKPVIGTRVGAIPELIEDRKSGFLVSPGDSNAIADRIVRLLDDEPLRTCMGRAGRELGTAKFEVSTAITRLLEFYGL